MGLCCPAFQDGTAVAVKELLLWVWIENQKEPQRPFCWTSKDNAVLVSWVFAASHRNTLDWRIVCYSELSITSESCFAISLSFHPCLSSTNGLFWWSWPCGSSDGVWGSGVVLLGCKTKSQQDVQCCLPEPRAVLAVGICLSPAGILPLGLGAPFFALSLSGVAGPWHSAGFAAQPLGGLQEELGFLDAWLWAALSSIPWLSSWSTFPDTWTWFLRYLSSLGRRMLWCSWISLIPEWVSSISKAVGGIWNRTNIQQILY